MKGDDIFGCAVISLGIFIVGAILHASVTQDANNKKTRIDRRNQYAVYVANINSESTITITIDQLPKVLTAHIVQVKVKLPAEGEHEVVLSGPTSVIIEIFRQLYSEWL